MSRIVEGVPIEERQTVCRQGCGKTVAYVPNDVQRADRTDYTGGPAGSEWIICPGCGKTITVRSW